MGLAVDSIYGSNLGSLSKQTLQDLIAKTTELLFRLHKWKSHIEPFRVLGFESDLSHWSASEFQSERYTLMLSIYYHKTAMLACAPLLTVVLERATDCSATSNASPNEVFFDLACPLMKRELRSISELQRILKGLLRHQPSFFKRNAAWWVCNFACTYAPSSVGRSALLIRARQL